MSRAIFVCVFFLLWGPTLAAQCPADAHQLDDTTTASVFDDYIMTVVEVRKSHPGLSDQELKDIRADALADPIAFLKSWAVTRSDLSLASRLADLELSRWNKEASSGSGASGTTSVTSQGSVASLFSFALENGALTRSVSGTTLTFRTSPANVVAALKKGGWIEAGTSVPAFDGSFESIARRLSFFVSFDASRGNSSGGSSNITSNSNAVFTGDRQQLSGWGSRFEIVNHRDPRDPRYSRDFRTLMLLSGKKLADRLQATERLIDADFAKSIAPALQESVEKHPDNKDEILKDYKIVDEQFRRLVCSYADSKPNTYQEINKASDEVASFLVHEADIFNRIARSWTLAYEYNVTRQANTNGSLPSSMTPASTTTATLPNLGSINLVTSKGFSDGPELTANASFTWFQSLPAGSKSSHIRDARVSAQLDIPLKEIKQIGKPTVSLSGLFLALFEQPLGQQVLVNNVPVSLTGNIGLVQGKLTIPTKSAVSIPISVSWASRTELIKESDVRGNIGITFDLDKLFAKGETKQ